MKKSFEMVLQCDKCGKAPQIDKEKSTEGWAVYDVKKPCECGGKFVMALKDGDRMTKKELSQLYYINRDIERLQRQHDELKCRADKSTSIITGLPRGASDRTNLLAELADLSNLLDAKIKESVAEYNRLNRYILTVQDHEMSTILALRFVNGLSWRQIAFSVGRGDQEDGIRMQVNRFLDEQ
jgi:hypothetical protein